MDSVGPPPASPKNSGSDPRNARCGACAFAFNGYVWGSCPNCEADDRRQYALRCRDCRQPFYASEREDYCPECGSGNTVVYTTPETPRSR